MMYMVLALIVIGMVWGMHAIAHHRVIQQEKENQARMDKFTKDREKRWAMQEKKDAKLYKHPARTTTTSPSRNFSSRNDLYDDDYSSSAVSQSSYSSSSSRDCSSSSYSSSSYDSGSSSCGGDSGGGGGGGD